MIGMTNLRVAPAKFDGTYPLPAGERVARFGTAEARPGSDRCPVNIRAQWDFARGDPWTDPFAEPRSLVVGTS